MTDDFRKTVWKFYIFQFFAGLHFFAAVLVPLYTDWSHVGLATGQALQSWFTFWVFVMEIPTGIVADKYGRKLSLFLGCLVSMVATLVYGIYPNLILFALGEFLFATGAALISGADKALFYDELVSIGKEAEVTKYWSRSRSFHLAGILFAGPIGSLMAGMWGINAPMLLTAIPCLISALVILTIKEKRVANTPGKEMRDFLKIGIEGLGYLRKSRHLTRWTINLLLVNVAAYFVIWLYQPLMATLNIPISYFGFGSFFLVLAEIGVLHLYGRLLKIFHSVRRILAVMAIGVAISFVVTSLFPSFGTLIFFLGIGGGFGLTRSEFMTLEMNKFIQSTKRATVNSAISMYSRIVQAGLNPIVGVTAQASLFTAMLLVGLVPFLTILFPLNTETKTPEGDGKTT